MLAHSYPDLQNKDNDKVISLHMEGAFRCAHNRCKCCSLIPKGRKEVISKVTGETHIIKGHLSCESNYVIYILECPCGLQNVGRTKQKLRERINKHRFNMKYRIMYHSVSRHFAHHHGGDPKLLTVTPLEQVKTPLSR